MCQVIRVHIYKMRGLAKFARREGIDNARLRDAIARAERGMIDADLGGGLIKQRVARLGEGRSGGYRMMIAYRMKDRAIFLLGFAKNERQNISAGELAALRELSAVWLDASARQIAEALTEGVLLEVTDE